MRILTLDIGTYAIKAVELDISFGRVELGNYVVERVIESDLTEVKAGADAQPQGEAGLEQAQPPPAASAPHEAERQILSQGQLAALRRLLIDRPFKYDKLAVNIPKAWITTRLFQFPTKDRKTIQSSLAFELDDDIPFSINDVIHDFAVVNSESSGSTIFTAVALKSDLMALATELQMLGLDPDSISIESWGLSHLLKRSIPKEYGGRPICVVNIGHRHASIHMFVNEVPVLTHVSTCAGMDITRALAQTYNLSYEVADRTKIDSAFLLTQVHLRGDAGEPVTKEQQQFASVIADALVPLIREIKQTLMSYKAQYKMAPRAIFITGGSCLIPNMQLFLEEQLQIPVFPLAYISQVVGQTLQLSEQSEAQISAAVGLGLANIKPDRNMTINLRKDALAKKGGIGTFDLRAFRRPLKYVAASLVFVYVNLIVQGVILSSRASKQQETLEKSMKSVLGAVSAGTIATYKNSPSALKSAVNKEMAKYKTTQAAPTKPQINAFDVLSKVTTSIPKSPRSDITLFEIKEGKLKLVGTVESATAPAAIAKALQDARPLEGVQEKSTPNPKTKKTDFEITAKVETPK